MVIPTSVVEIEDRAINPVVSLLILPQKFKPRFDYVNTKIFDGTRYKYQWEYYNEKRKVFFHGDQNLIDYLNAASDNLLQLRSYYPLFK